MKTKISAVQLFAIMVLLPYGSAVLFFLTPDAKQDGWIPILLYIPAGITLQLLYTALFYQYPQDTLVTYLPKILGRWVGNGLNFIYIVYFSYLAARVLRDFSELTLIAAEPDMPLLLASAVLMTAFAYGAFSGIENLSRAAQITLPIILFVLFLLNIFLFLTPSVVKFNNLKPIMEEDILSIMKSAWPLITFPYGETFAFTMIYPSVNDPAKVRKTSLLAIIFLGIILALNTIMFIVTLGVPFASTSQFPLFESMRLIKLGFFDKLDIFILIIMVLGGSVKVSIFTYVAMLGTSQLVKLNDPKYLAIPFGIGVVILSMLIAPNYPEHIKIGLKVTPLYIHLPLQIVVPAVVLIISYMRKAIKKTPVL